jgi:hypothetical protein
MNIVLLILLSRLSLYIDEPDQPLIRFFFLNSSYTGYNETVHQLFIDFKKTCDALRREVLYNILREFEEPMKIVRLIKML